MCLVHFDTLCLHAPSCFMHNSGSWLRRSVPADFLSPFHLLQRGGWGQESFWCRTSVPVPAPVGVDGVPQLHLVPFSLLCAISPALLRAKCSGFCVEGGVFAVPHHWRAFVDLFIPSLACVLVSEPRMV